jgi:3-hydroxyisobutyrate dehydrogenase-like beta-hydroxyacid dehydrogenase
MASEPGAPADSAVAFLGLGALGSPMAANLLKAGFPLTVHNRTRGREAILVNAGAAAAPTPAAAVATAQLVCLCLSDDAAVESVLFGPQEPSNTQSNTGALPAIQGLSPGALVVDFSTIAPASSQAVAARLAELGIAYLDAPVTGGTEGARAGSLSVLVGGASTDLERARPLLEVVGNRITHVGPVGAGQQAKAVNQVLVAGSYAAVAEALALGQRLGLGMDQVVAALTEGAAGSWALQHRSAAMLKQQFPLGFRLSLHRKDLAIALAAAGACDLDLPVTTLVAGLEDELIARGHGDEDVAALARWFCPAD